MLTIRLLISIVILVFASIAWSQGSDKGAKGELQEFEKSDSNADKNKNLAHPPVTITVSPTITATNKPDHPAGNEEKESKPWEALTGLATLALALITMGLAYFTLKLWRSTGELVEGAERSSNTELRAYLGIKDHTIRTVNDSTGTLRFQAVITLENGGRTPARNVRRALEVGVGEKTRNDFSVGPLTGRMQMIPQYQWEMRQIFWHLTQEEINQITASALHAFVWGRVEYDDIYSTPQHLNFRFITREISGPGGGVITGWALHPTEDGNDAT